MDEEREELAVWQRTDDEERWERYCVTGEAVSHDRVRTWLASLSEGLDDACRR